MICSEWPSAWELWVCRPDKNQGWVRYQLYETHQQAKNVLKRVEGAPLEFKIVPLYSAVADGLPSNVELTALRAAIAEQEKCEPVAAGPEDQAIYDKIAANYHTHPAPVPAGMMLVGWLDERTRFFCVDDPMYKDRHDGMREVYAAPKPEDLK